jgi:acetolactate synthase I/II/III large subunit
MPHMRTADAVIESLIRHGIDTLYAVPGVHNDHLFDAAHRAQDRFRVLHHGMSRLPPTWRSARRW